MPYEVRGGYALADTQLWPFVQDVLRLELSCFGPLLAELKSRVRAARLRAATSVTCGLNQLYWEIGSTIARAQESKGCG